MEIEENNSKLPYHQPLTEWPNLTDGAMIDREVINIQKETFSKSDDNRTNITGKIREGRNCKTNTSDMKDYSKIILLLKSDFFVFRNIYCNLCWMDASVCLACVCTRRNKKTQKSNEWSSQGPAKLVSLPLFPFPCPSDLLTNID